MTNAYSRPVRSRKLTDKVLLRRTALIRQFIKLSGTRAEAAHRMGVDVSTLDHWTFGRRDMHPTSAALMEKLSGGRISKERLIFG